MPQPAIHLASQAYQESGLEKWLIIRHHFVANGVVVPVTQPSDRLIRRDSDGATAP